MGFLPWEEWLPPYIFGPAVFLLSVLCLVLNNDLPWWGMALLSFGAIWSAWGTWVWFSVGRNVFNPNARKSDEEHEGKAE
jgi:hypothetical protein